MKKYELHETTNSLDEWKITSDCEKVMFITDNGEMVTCTDWDCGYRGTDHNAFNTKDYNHLIYVTPEVNSISMESTPTYEQKQAVLEVVRDWSEKGYVTEVNTIDNPNYGDAVNKLIDCGLDAVSAIELLFEQSVVFYDYDELDDYFSPNEQDDLYYCDDFVFDITY